MGKRVIAYHLNFAAYGFWLPNDPRGSNSDRVWTHHLRPLGKATKVSHRRSVARDPHDIALRATAKRALMYRPVVFSGMQARCIALAFGEWARHAGVVIYACAVLPKHVHLVVGRHDYRAEQIVNLLKGAATRRLLEEGLHPFRGRPKGDAKLPSPWGRGCRKIFLCSPEEIRREIEYVRTNPIREGKREQLWSFVTPFEG